MLMEEKDFALCACDHLSIILFLMYFTCKLLFTIIICFLGAVSTVYEKIFVVYCIPLCSSQ